MKKTMKKALAWLGTAMMTLGLVTAPALSARAAVDVESLSDGTAYLNINKADWSDYEATYTNAEITGDGQYTVSMEAKEAIDAGEFNALEVKNGESALGNGSVITIDEIKINGTAIELAGESYTCSADGGGVTTRVNLHNVYNKPIEDDGTIASDVRTAGDLEKATAELWTEEQGKGMTSLEVTFTVSDYGKTVEVATDDSAPTATLTEAIATLNINNVDWSEFEATLTNAEITGDGSYEVSMTMAEPQDLGEFNALEVPEGELLMGNRCIITIDEIKLNDTVVQPEKPSYTCSADGAGITTRVNLHNIYNNPVDENGEVGSDVRAAVDPKDTSAVLWTEEESKGITSIVVKFTVSDYGKNEAVAEEAAPSVGEVDKDGEYNAYILIQSPKYSFRNAWYDAQYGLGYTDDTGFDYFNQITGWDADGNALVIPGTIQDAKITGNGTYTVSVTGLQFADDDFKDQQNFNIIGVDTDIPFSEDIVISDMELSVNGTGVDINPIVADVEETNGYLTMMIQNIWNDKIKEIGYTPTPVTDISITFKVSGFNYDNEAVTEATTSEETTTEAAATETKEESKGMNKGLIAGIAAAVVAVVAIVVGVVVGGKKKDEKEDK